MAEQVRDAQVARAFHGERAVGRVGIDFCLVLLFFAEADIVEAAVGEEAAFGGFGAFNALDDDHAVVELRFRAGVARNASADVIDDGQAIILRIRVPFADVVARELVARRMVPADDDGVAHAKRVGHVDGFLGIAHDGALCAFCCDCPDGVGARCSIAADGIQEVAVRVVRCADLLAVASHDDMVDVLCLRRSGLPGDHVEVGLEVASSKLDFYVVADLDSVIQFSTVVVNTDPVSTVLGDGNGTLMRTV